MNYRKHKKKYDHFVIAPCSNKLATNPVFVRLYGSLNGAYYLCAQAVAPDPEWESKLGAEYTVDEIYPHLDNV